jgi:hypothetical protein
MILRGGEGHGIVALVVVVLVVVRDFFFELDAVLDLLVRANVWVCVNVGGGGGEGVIVFPG